jgi:hypothetical protein
MDRISRITSNPVIGVHHSWQSTARIRSATVRYLRSSIPGRVVEVESPKYSGSKEITVSPNRVNSHDLCGEAVTIDKDEDYGEKAIGPRFDSLIRRE